LWGKSSFETWLERCRPAPALSLPPAPRGKDRKPPSASALQENPKWAKLSGDTKIIFRKAWKIYQDMSREYRQDVLDGVSRSAKPTPAEFRDRVLAKIKWEVGERRLRDVIDLGETG